jgi:hypothetical protein
MLSVILDTGLFAVPPYSDKEEHVHGIIKRLFHWSSVVEGRGPVRGVRLSDAVTALAIAGCFPFENNLEALFGLYGLHEVFTVRDVARIYQSFIANTEVLSDIGVEVTRCEDLTIEPDLLRDYAMSNPECVVEQTGLAYANQCLPIVYRETCVTFVASGIPHTGPTMIHLTGSATALAGTGSEDIHLPIPLDGQTYLLDRIGDIAGCFDPLDLWANAGEPKDFFVALSMGCVAKVLASGNSLSLREIPPFAIGQDFVKSLAQAQAGPRQAKSRVVFDACCGVILRESNRRLTPMGRPQFIRSQDGATAWRTHITSRHEALRLMVWNSQGCLELANIGNKHELYITRGYGRCYSYGW